MLYFWGKGMSELTVGELKSALSGLPDDMQVTFGSSRYSKRPLIFYRFKKRDDGLQIELNELDPELWENVYGLERRVSGSDRREHTSERGDDLLHVENELDPELWENVSGLDRRGMHESDLRSVSGTDRRRHKSDRRVSGGVDRRVSKLEHRVSELEYRITVGDIRNQLSDGCWKDSDQVTFGSTVDEIPLFSNQPGAVFSFNLDQD